MGLVVVAALAALALSLVTGGAPRWARRVHVLGLPVVAIAVALQAVALLAPLPEAVRLGLVAVSLLAALVVVVVNRRLPGVVLIGAGLLLNALVITVNGAMPVSLDAAARAGLSETSLRLDSDRGREEAGPATRLRPLGDVLPLALPPRREVVSAGDVLVAAGAAAYVWGVTRPRAKRRRRRPGPASHPRVANGRRSTS